MESRMTWLDKLLGYIYAGIILCIILVYCILRLPWYAYGYYVYPKRCISRIDALYDCITLEWEETEVIVRRANEKWDGKILTLSGRFYPVRIPLSFDGKFDFCRLRLSMMFSELYVKEQIHWQDKKGLQESGEIFTGQTIEEIEEETKRQGYATMFCKRNTDNARFIDVKEISLGFWEGVFEPAFAYKNENMI